MQRLRQQAVFIVSIILAFALLRSGMFGLVSPLSLSGAQLCVLPLWILLISRIRFCGERLPLWVPGVACVVGLFGAAAGYGLWRFDTRVVYMAQLQGDEYEAESRVFRERVNERLKGLGSLRVARMVGIISGASEAAARLEHDQKTMALLWGDKRWLHVSLGAAKAASLGDLGMPRQYGEAAGLRLVTGVERVSLPMEPQRETADFLAFLFEGLGRLDREIVKEGGFERDHAELALMSAGLIVAPWRGAAHRGFAWWRLGNLYMERAVAGGGYQAGWLGCALRAYRKASGLVQVGANPGLYRAISNNLGVALQLQSVWEGRRDLSDSAVAAWKLVLRGPYVLGGKRKRPAAVDSLAEVIALENLKVSKVLRSRASQVSGVKRKVFKKGRRKRIKHAE